MEIFGLHHVTAISADIRQNSGPGFAVDEEEAHLGESVVEATPMKVPIEVESGVGADWLSAH